MIPFRYLKDKITELNVQRCRVHDRNGNLLYEYNGESPDDLVNHLEGAREFLTHVSPANVTLAKRDWTTGAQRDAFKWLVDFTDGQAAVNKPVAGMVQPYNFSPYGQLKEMIGAMQMLNALQGGNTVSSQHLELMKEIQALKHERELEKLKAEKNDFWNNYGPAAPFLLSALGKTPDEIKGIMSMAALSRPAGIAGTPNAIKASTDVKELMNKPNEEKNAEIDKLLTELATKISAEQMVVLLRVLCEKPELAEKAIQLVNAGMI